MGFGQRLGGEACGIAVDRQAVAADRLDVGIDAALPLHLGGPVVELLELMGIVAAVLVDHVGEQLHRFPG
jgi:hypothetical protein